MYSDASFQEWIVSFRQASYVITDSFHGTVFAIKNKKEVILCSHEGKVAKIESLMNMFGINRGFYDGSVNISTYLAEAIEYGSVQLEIEKKVSESKLYLIDSLKKALQLET